MIKYFLEPFESGDLFLVKEDHKDGYWRRGDIFKAINKTHAKPIGVKYYANGEPVLTGARPREDWIKL